MTAKHKIHRLLRMIWSPKHENYRILLMRESREFTNFTNSQKVRIFGSETIEIGTIEICTFKIETIYVEIAEFWTIRAWTI